MQGGGGNDDLDNAGLIGKRGPTTVADPYVSRRRLSRSSNAQQSRSTRAASFFGSISLLVCSAIVRQSSEYGAIAGPPFLRTHTTLASLDESEQYQSLLIRNS
jgi:hypothetical protein